MCRRKTLDVLAGVGAPDRGEWEEWTGKAFHIRRRLTSAEEDGVGPAVDIRGTEEARGRVQKVVASCPHVPKEWAYDEAGISIY